VNKKRISLVGVALASLLLGCSREPAIVIRFDAFDMAGRGDLARATAAPPSSPDAALAFPPDAAVAAGKPRPKAEAGKVDAPSPIAKEAPLKAEAQCKGDADCVIVPDGCCSCANGGKQRAARKIEADALRAAQREACKDVMCTMMVSTDPTCGKRAACVEGACAMRAAKAEEQRKIGPAQGSPVP